MFILKLMTLMKVCNVHSSRKSHKDFYTMPCAIIALATFMNPAIFAPFT